MSYYTKYGYGHKHFPLYNTGDATSITLPDALQKTTPPWNAHNHVGILRWRYSTHEFFSALWSKVTCSILPSIPTCMWHSYCPSNKLYRGPSISWAHWLSKRPEPKAFLKEGPRQHNRWAMSILKIHMDFRKGWIMQPCQRSRGPFGAPWVGFKMLGLQKKPMVEALLEHLPWG